MHSAVDKDGTHKMAYDKTKGGVKMYGNDATAEMIAATYGQMDRTEQKKLAAANRELDKNSKEGKKRQKDIGDWLGISGLFTFVGVVITGLATILSRSDLLSIITLRPGASGTRTIGEIATCTALGLIGDICAAIAIFALLMAGWTWYSPIRQLRRFARQVKRARQQEVASTTAKARAKARIEASVDLGTPEGVHAYVKAELETAAPNSATQRWTQKLLDQLDQMNDLQKRLEILYAVNKVHKLDEIKDLLQDIENALCMASTRRAINYLIIGDEKTLASHIEQTLKDNQMLLDQAQGTLSDVVEFINGEKSLDGITHEIALAREAIRNFTKEEVEDELLSARSENSQAPTEVSRPAHAGAAVVQQRAR